ncbi:hypothetical protein C2W58_02736 [Bacillus pumilus]|uniref:Uncharacterized protein n=1 Tax=Bacillus pumilus TaxID=1408 RepID=A0AB34QS89_BACPU|nr:hypothetical protein BAT_1906 [Bacillus pumilus ATCC 7061]KIL17057.1 hypothetical protein B4127_2322 [Bacillus pumilus]RAP13818.1 hypothetical protein C2W58_02736 [Bacillus pumilus]
MDKFVSIGTDKKIDRLNRMTVCPLQDTMNKEDGVTMNHESKSRR